MEIYLHFRERSNLPTFLPSLSLSFFEGKHIPYKVTITFRESIPDYIRRKWEGKRPQYFISKIFSITARLKFLYTNFSFHAKEFERKKKTFVRQCSFQFQNFFSKAFPGVPILEMIQPNHAREFHEKRFGLT